MRRFWLVLLCCALLTGCVPAVAESPAPTEDTHVAVLPRKEGFEFGVTVFPFAITGYGFDGDLRLDGDGMYYSYEGGEMCVTTFHTARGLSQKGIALFLYVDGRAQPFRTEAEPEDAYLHMIYPKNNQDTFTELYFTPLTGKEGDTLEICVLSIADPYYSFTNGPNAQETCSSVVQMKYEATPPACVMPAVQDRICSWTSYTEERLSERVYDKEVDWSLRIGGRYATSGPLHYNFRKETVLLSVRLWGDPAAEFGLIFYVDHQPVSVDPDNIMLVQPVAGEDLVISAELDLSDFRNQALVYAVLVPRNYRSGELGGSCELRTSGLFYLLGGSQPLYIEESPADP